MRTNPGIVAGVLAGLVCVGALPAHAIDGSGLAAGHADTSPWQARVAYTSATPVWRSGLGGFESGGFTVKRSSGVASLNLLGDYFFAAPSAFGSDGGGLRATSGFIIASRSQLSVSQTSLPSGLFGSPSRVFGSSALAASPEAGGDTATLPYLGVGYTGASARGGWSFSADLGMVGPRNGSAAARPFGSNAQRSVEDAARDLRPMPLLQVGVLYSF